MRDASLETPTARRKLTPRRKPYYRKIDKELQLGYRKGKHSGSWVLRRYLGSGKYKVESFATADDNVGADGRSVLDYWQAVERTRQLFSRKTGAALTHSGPYTIGDAIEDYLAYVQAYKKDVSNTRNRALNWIVPPLGKLDCEKLTRERIERWLKDVAASPARVRCTAEGEPQFRDWSDDSEAVRSRKATANRCLVILKAALNRAHDAQLISSDDGWRKVRAFPETVAARARYLTTEECRRILDAAEPALRSLIHAALATGARYGELTTLTCGDFHPDTGLLHIRTAKSGKGRHVVLNDEGDSIFESLTAGRATDSIIFLKTNGMSWGPGHQVRPFQTAVKRAGIAPPIGFHGLRHTYASLAIIGGMPLLVVAKNLGHSDTRMVEKHTATLPIAIWPRQSARQRPRSALASWLRRRLSNDPFSGVLSTG